MRPLSLTLYVAACAVLLAGCKSSTGGSSDTGGQVTSTAATSTVSTSSTTPPTSGTPAPSPKPSDVGVATALDPCTLVTRQEASALAGVSFGKGKEESNNHGKRCIYGSQTLNVFTVELGQAKNAATAQAEWTAAKDEASAAVNKQTPPGIHVSLVTHSVSGIGDKAVTVSGHTTIETRTIGFSGIYLLKGATFVGFQDLQLGTAPPSVSAFETEARTVVGRLS